MADISDFELEKDSGFREFNPEPKTGLIVGILLIIVAIAVGWYVMRDGPVTEQEAATPAAAETAGSPAASVPEIPLPPLDQTDMLVRTLASALSSHPLFASWLATDGIIRRFTVVVDNIAYGQPVRKQLTEVAPPGTFRATAGTQPRTDPRNYDRYVQLAGAMESLEPARAAQMYAMLRPRIEEAYVELGRNVSFDSTLERAIISLLQAPPVRGTETLARKEAMFVYTNPQLEQLTPAQKHLLRMGPDQAAAVQARLRELALALGIPRDRLP